jgi:hypothetical protein
MMSTKMLRAVLLGTLLAGPPLLAWSQETPAEAGAKAPASAQKDPDSSTASESAKDKKSSPPNKVSDKDFVPSEKISADAEVTFPTDI